MDERIKKLLAACELAKAMGDKDTEIAMITACAMRTGYEIGKCSAS